MMKNKKNIIKLVLIILFLLFIDGFGYVVTNGFKRGIIVELAFCLLEILLTIWLMKDIWNPKP